ncbi:MAG TPA: polysaccharide deacetylase family protein [Clostridia bacterium]|nr:polysaccharide deacetylase family protein [Clostridia bacterium]
MKKAAYVFIGIILILSVAWFSMYKTMNSRTFQFFGELVPRVNTDQKVVALTFDDGPTEKTAEILQVLEEAGIKATFFLKGGSMSEYPDQAGKIAAAGHELGNHTYSHNRMIFKSYSYIKKEIEDTDKLIREAGYKGEIHFRPPNGKKLVLLPYYLSKNSKRTIMWNMEPDSYPEIAGSAEKIVEYVNNNIEPGSIILLHVMYDNEERKSLEAIQGIVSSLSEKGYEFKTISELLEYGK